MEKISA